MYTVASYVYIRADVGISCLLIMDIRTLLVAFSNWDP